MWVSYSSEIMETLKSLRLIIIILRSSVILNANDLLQSQKRKKLHRILQMLIRICECDKLCLYFFFYLHGNFYLINRDILVCGHPTIILVKDIFLFFLTVTWRYYIEQFQHAYLNPFLVMENFFSKQFDPPLAFSLFLFIGNG